jgi:hypothetical protein
MNYEIYTCFLIPTLANVLVLYRTYDFKLRLKLRMCCGYFVIADAAMATGAVK